MSDHFLDAGALAKRYVNEIGSQWIRQLTDAHPGGFGALGRDHFGRSRSRYRRQTPDAQLMIR